MHGGLNTYLPVANEIEVPGLRVCFIEYSLCLVKLELFIDNALVLGNLSAFMPGLLLLRKVVRRRHMGLCIEI